MKIALAFCLADVGQSVSLSVDILSYLLSNYKIYQYMTLEIDRQIGHD